MSDYAAVVNQIQGSTTVTEIAQAARSYSAAAVGAGGILYSGDVGCEIASNLDPTLESSTLLMLFWKIEINGVIFRAQA